MRLRTFEKFLPEFQKNNLHFIPYFCPVLQVHTTIKEDGTTENEHIYSSLKKCLNEVEWWACAAKHQMEFHGKPNQK